MYISQDMLAEIERQYGTPAERTFGVAVGRDEYDFIKSSQTDGRNHDVTLYITKGDKVIVNSKHFYPPDLYRAPSGGIQLGEDFHTGVFREVAEEIGCEVALERYIMRTSVAFVCGRDMIHWRSFVFLGRYISGDFDFTDHREIREVHVADWSEFEHYGRVMRESDKGGLHYRAAMHDEFMSLVAEYVNVR